MSRALRRALPRIAALLILIALAGFLWFALFPPSPAPPGTRTDAVVVLTGGPGRLARGLAVLAQGKARRLLVSGVDRQVKAPELAARAHAPMALFDCCVDLGHEAVDTRSNAGETRAWMDKHGYRSLRLVTSADHMRRAALELRAELGPRITVVPDPVAADRPTMALFREFLKYCVRRVTLLFGG